MFRTACFILALLVLPLSAHAANRYALVIGNDAYDEVASLEKAVADASAMARRLEELGFQTILATNVGRREFNLAVASFTKQLAPGDTAVVFYAGHGVEIDGENYLLPTDIIAPSEVQSGLITSESIGLSSLLDRIRKTGVRTTLAFVDACRDNPFSEKAGRSIGGARGLGRIAAPEGTFVVFSAGAGQQALDRLGEADPNPNSVFTRNLLPRLSEPGLELRDMIADLRIDVRDLARTRNHAQFPAYYDELLGDFYFLAEASAIQEPPQINPPAAPENGDAIARDFELARQIGSEAAIRAFIAKYEGSGDFTLVLAQQMLDELNGDHEEAEAAALVETELQPEPNGTDQAREIMRQTQAQLNRLGCNAGGADGIAGRRTRAAFSSFISATGAQLSSGDLGSQKALDVLRAATAPACQQVAAVPGAPVTSNQSPPTGPTLAGTWSYRYTCAVVVKGSGTAVISHAGGNRFNVRSTESNGTTATGYFTMNGLSFSGPIANSTGVSSIERGTLDASGNSYRSSNNLTCSIRATRVR